MSLHIFPTPDAAPRSGYLLIDASNLDGDTFAEALPMLRCTPAALTQSDELMPRLIDVAALSPAQQDGLGAALLREITGQRPPVICAWLESSLDADALARHIARFLVGPGGGGTGVFWRYFDPRVFTLAAQLFPASQTDALLGPVVEWRLPWCRRWWQVTGPGRDIAPLAGLMAAWPSAKQWTSLEHSELNAQVLLQLQELRGPLTDEDCLRAQRDIDASLREGKQGLQLSDPHDLAEYAFYCVRYGSDFRRHPKLAGAWLALAQGGANWCDVPAMLDEDDYRWLDDSVQPQHLPTGAAYAL